MSEPRTETKVFSSYQDYLRSTSLGGLYPLVLAAATYFAIAMILLVHFAPPELIGWLLLQKGLYIVLALQFARHLRHGRYPVQRLESYFGLVLFMCLSSAMVTAWAGLRGSFSAYCAVLVLGICMVEISWRRAAASWMVVWAAWLFIHQSSPHDQLLLEFSKLVGMQVVALPAMGLRLRMSRKQYELIVELEDALQQSEKARLGLDAAVEERTAELRAANQEQIRLQDQLVQSQKLESLGRLAGGVAHDFNNFLTVILGNLELIRSDMPEEERREYVRDAESAVQRASEVTAQLLAFSRKEVLKLERIKIQSVVQDSLRMVDRLVGEDIQVTSRLDCPGVLVEGDRVRLQQVLLNLVINARDAMPRGGQLSIELSQQGRGVLLQVRDTGCGMDEATRKRVLEPFFTTKPVGKGTGLGLSTVDGIVSMHHGKLGIESTSGQGATIRVWLPACDEPVGDSSSRSRRVVSGGGRGRILLVEDDDQLRKLTYRVLRLLGYEVKAMENGEQTLAWLESHHDHDLLITDAVMPGMDGARLAQAVREKLPELPILFISGYADDRLSDFGIARGEGNFLAKPFTPAQLQASVQELLAN